MSFLTNTGGRCFYVFDPDLWPHDVHSIDQPWHCPYPSVDGSHFCIFHLLPHDRRAYFPDRGDRLAEYLKAIRSTNILQIVGTIIESSQISPLLSLIRSRTEVQIGFSTLTGSLDLTERDLNNHFSIESCSIDKLDFTGAVFNGRLSIKRSAIDQANFSEIEFNQRCVFQETTFRDARFINTNFNEEVTFCAPLPTHVSIANIEGVLGNDACRFKSTAEFLGTNFNRSAIFAGVDFERGATFYHATFDGGSSFYRADFHIGSHFNFSEFRDETDFTEADMGLCDFDKAQFDGPALFDKATFGTDMHYLSDDTVHNHASVEGITETTSENVLKNKIFARAIERVIPYSASIDDCTSDDLFSVNDVLSKNSITMFSSRFKHLRLDIKFHTSPSSVALFGGTVNEGIFEISESTSYYELASATIGDVSIKSSSEVNTFDNILIDNTGFDGFDFFAHRDALREVRWRIAGVATEDNQINPDSEETTYAKAKAGADEIGDTNAMGEFFIQERRSRRNIYWGNVRKGNPKQRLSSLIKICVNGLYDMLCEYAENSGRVIIISIGSILIFSIIYFIAGVDIPYRDLHPVTIPLTNSVLSLGWVSYLIFSMQAFSAFSLAGGAEIANPVVRMFASLQSFIGAFLIGLFVATIVRSVER